MNWIIEHFGSDKIRRPANIARFGVLVVHCQAKIAQFGGADIIEQNIAQFEIAMNNAFVVNVLQRQCDLAYNFGYFCLRYLKFKIIIFYFET